MTDQTYTLDQAHRYFGVEYNNAIFPIITQANPSPEAQSRAISLAHAALLHWEAYSGFKIVNKQRGLYMLAKAYLCANDALNAQRYAQQCFDISQAHSQEMQDFDHAYAHELMARVEALKGNQEGFKKYYDQATKLGNELSNKEDQKIFQGDMESGNWYKMIQ